MFSLLNPVSMLSNETGWYSWSWELWCCAWSSLIIIIVVIISTLSSGKAESSCWAETWQSSIQTDVSWETATSCLSASQRHSGRVASSRRLYCCWRNRERQEYPGAAVHTGGKLANFFTTVIANQLFVSIIYYSPLHSSNNRRKIRNIY